MHDDDDDNGGSKVVFRVERETQRFINLKHISSIRRCRSSSRRALALNLFTYEQYLNDWVSRWSRQCDPELCSSHPQKRSSCIAISPTCFSYIYVRLQCQETTFVESYFRSIHRSKVS